LIIIPGRSWVAGIAIGGNALLLGFAACLSGANLQGTDSRHQCYWPKINILYGSRNFENPLLKTRRIHDRPDSLMLVGGIQGLQYSLRGALMREGRYEPDQGGRIGTAVTFLLIGLGAGAVVGMLFAPKTGRQMRRDLRRGYEQARDTFEDWKDTARDFAEEAIERGSDLAEDVRDRMKPLARGIRRG
jgi:gas vesicle protein